MTTNRNARQGAGGGGTDTPTDWRESMLEGHDLVLDDGRRLEPELDPETAAAIARLRGEDPPADQ